eukprot:4109503-Prymnesium_polylepis.1
MHLQLPRLKADQPEDRERGQLHRQRLGAAEAAQLVRYPVRRPHALRDAPPLRPVGRAVGHLHG